MAKVHIETKGIHTSVWIDDVRISGICGFSIKGRAGDIPKLELTIPIAEFTYDDGESLPILPEPWRSIYSNQTDDAIAKGLQLSSDAIRQAICDMLAKEKENSTGQSD